LLSIVPSVHHRKPHVLNVFDIFGHTRFESYLRSQIDEKLSRLTSVV
jgi:hypothetical protein